MDICCKSCIRSVVCKYKTAFETKYEELKKWIDIAEKEDIPISIDIDCKYYMDTHKASVIPFGGKELPYQIIKTRGDTNE